MSDFFDQARRLGEKNLLGDFQSDYSFVEEVRDTLDNAHKRSRFEIQNLEIILNLIETGDLLGKQHVLGELNLPKTRECLVRLVAGVLERKQQFDSNALPDILADGDGEIIQNPPSAHAPLKRVGPVGYDELARLIRSLQHHDPQFSCDFVTFNYDLGLELSLWARKVEWRYGTSTLGNGPVGIFKVHGSVGWTTKEDVNCTPFRESAQQFLDTPINHKDLHTARFSLRAFSQMGGRYVPLIVPPSENKALHRDQFSSMWKQAGVSIGRANIIAVAGYSLPQTDQFVRHWFSLSNASTSLLRHVHLCDASSNALTTWTTLLGKPVEEKIKTSNDFRYFARDIWDKFRTRGLLW